jgi:CBS domain-containing protein
MNPNPTSVRNDEKAYTAFCLMQGRAKPITVLPILDEKNPTSVRNDEKAYTAFCLMQGRPKPITVLPILDKKGRPVGMLRLQDLVAAGL